MEETDVNARWQADMAPFFELPSGERPDTGFVRLRGDLPPCLTSPRSTSARRAGAWSAAGSTASACRSTSCTASRTGPCGCPTACGGTCSRCSREALEGLRRAAADGGELGGVGVDAWGVDYALLDGERRVLGLPFHYRDGRTDGMVARAHARVPREELYAVTGIQTMPINTVFQLLADEGSRRARRRPSASRSSPTSSPCG